MDILKLLGIALAWVSGVVAGIAAFLYALGFAETVANQRMLGVSWGVIARDPLWYLGAGGQVLIGWLAEAMVVFFLVAIAGQMFFLLVAWLRRRRGQLVMLARAADWIDRHVVWLLAMLAMVVTGSLLSSVAELARIRNLLLDEPSATCAAGGLTAAVIRADDAVLADWSNAVTIYSALAIGLGSFAVPRLAAGEGPALPLLICIAVTINAILSIPIAHGVLRVDTRWPSVTGDESLATVPAGTLRLLGRTPDGVWAWKPEDRTVHVFIAGSYRHLEIGPTRTIADLLHCGGSEPKSGGAQ